MAVDKPQDVVTKQQYLQGLDYFKAAQDDYNNVRFTAIEQDVSGLETNLNNHTVGTDVPANAVFTDTTYEAMSSAELEDGLSTQGRLIDAHTLATFILTVAADVVNNAPEALDTLAELAQALGEDPNFATTVMNVIGQKLDKAGGVVTGDLTVNGTLTADVSGNAATATKLQTPRTLWGQSFDGSGNVSGNMTVVGDIVASGPVTGKILVSTAVDTADEGGQVDLNASKNTYNGISIDNYKGKFRIFGIQSADGTTKSGIGTILEIDPYAKTINGGYTLTGNVSGNAATATKINGKTIPVVSSFDSTTGVLALTSLS